MAIQPFGDHLKEISREGNNTAVRRALSYAEGIEVTIKDLDYAIRTADEAVKKATDERNKLVDERKDAAANLAEATAYAATLAKETSDEAAYRANPPASGQ